MKILSVQQIREADAYTIQNEPISSVDLMERAAFQLFKWIKKRVDQSHSIKIFAGPGNNGGDGLVLGRYLAQENYQVDFYLVQFTDKASDDFSINLKRLQEIGLDHHIHPVTSKNDLPEPDENDLLIDALFGSGLTRPVTGLAGDVISMMNEAPSITIAVDIPSGLPADGPANDKQGMIIRADYTLSFQMPKLAFMLPGNDQYVGKWKILDIGLLPEYLHGATTKNFFMQKRDIRPMIKNRKKYAHKGSFGHALLIAGSYGKIGAAVLSSMACLRSGVGLLHTHIPLAGNSIMQTSVPESMISLDTDERIFSSVPDLSVFNCIGIGPGLGQEKQTANALKLLIQECRSPLVIDADALNILSENKTWLAFLPHGSILTPHPGEFERLTGKWQNDFEKLDMLRSFCQKYQVYVALKGAHTAVCFPDGSIYFNSTGNPGMATAGSGDVLTGIVLALLAQGYTPGQAAVIGVYIHGLAGDLAAKKQGYESLIASDIIANLGKAFKKVHTSFS